MTRIVTLCCAVLATALLAVVLFSLTAGTGKTQGTAVRTPFAVNLCTHSGLGCGNTPQFFTPAAGVQTVIEQMSGTCTANGQFVVVLALNANVGGSTHILSVLPLVPNPALGTGFAVPTTLTRLYPDAGTPVRVIFQTLGSQGPNSYAIACSVSITGYTTTAL